MARFVKSYLSILVLFLLISCGNTTAPSSSIIITSPASSGMVTIVGSKGAVSGEGTVTASNLTASTSTTTAFLVAGCTDTDDTDSAHSDGSFFALSVCADVNHKIQVSHTDTNGNSTVVGSFTVPANSASVCTGQDQRLFKITNNADEDIWLGLTAGTMSCKTNSDCPTNAAGSCQGADPTIGKAGTCTCASGNECGSIAQCRSDNNFCYWNLPNLGIAQMNLAANGGHSVICFPAPSDGFGIQWSGNMFARTGCDDTGKSCDTGECNSSANEPCPTGTGGNPPASLFEFTISNQTSTAPTTAGPDFYDISIINGINLGMTVGPVSGTFEADSSNPYSCGNPGSQTAIGSLKACSWTVNPMVSGVDRSTLLRDVTPTSFAAAGTCPNGDTPNSLGNCACTADSDCSSSNLLCGNALNASTDVQYTMVCGEQIGWWTANQICGSSINNKAPLVPFGEPLNCATTITNSDGSESTYTNLHICTKPDNAPNDEQAQSCYNNAAIEDCCGCATSSGGPFFDTWDLALSPSFPGSDNGCFATNTNWETIAQSWLVFLKQLCPTVYTYPFDDATSTFTCQKGSGKGPPSYELTFFSTQ